MVFIKNAYLRSFKVVFTWSGKRGEAQDILLDNHDYRYRKAVKELCTNHRTVTADTALILATVSGNTADFWLNLRQRIELWKALNTQKRRARIEKTRTIVA